MQLYNIIYTGAHQHLYGNRFGPYEYTIYIHGPFGKGPVRGSTFVPGEVGPELSLRGRATPNELESKLLEGGPI